MNLFRRIRINVRKGGRVASTKISVREKEFYVCAECRNRYDAPHFFCPQCLGLLRSGAERLCSLKLAAVEESRVLEISRLIESLSGATNRALQKALRKPCTLFAGTDPGVAQEWKEVLEAEKLGPLVELSGLAEKKRTRKKQPVFPNPASLPRLLSAATDEQVRAAGKSIQNAGIRMRWIELVLLGFRIIEHCYKRKPADRVIFNDYLFHIDQRLLEAARDWLTYYRLHEQEFVKVIEPIKADFERMQAEIDAVHRQVEEQL